MTDNGIGGGEGRDPEDIEEAGCGCAVSALVCGIVLLALGMKCVLEWTGRLNQ